MIYINFNQEEINQLNYERYHHPHPRVQKRAKEPCFWWMGLTLSIELI